MKENDGWVKIHRKITQWEWYEDINTRLVFLHLILTANHKDSRWMGIEIKKGELVTSLRKLAKSIGISTQSLRTSLTRLKSTHEITQLSNTKYTHISINKYCSYQETNTITNKRLTQSQHTSNNKQEGKECKNDKEVYIAIVSYFNKVMGTNFKSVENSNIDYWINKGFSLEEINQAISNLPVMSNNDKEDGFWKKMTPTRFFRTRNANGVPDTIEQALNYQPPKKQIDYSRIDNIV